MVHCIRNDELLWGVAFESFVVLREYEVVKEFEGVVFEGVLRS